MSAEFTHSPTPEAIMEYLDGEGTPATRESIAAHLATCGTCQAVAADLRGVSAHTQAWTVDSAPASLQAPRSGPAKVLWFRAWRPSRVAMAALATACAVLLVSSFISRNTRVAVGRPPGVFATAQKTTADDANSAPAMGQANAPVPMAAASPREIPEAGAQSGLRTPAVIRTARLQIVAKDFTRVRAEVESLVSGAAGFI